MGQSASQAAAFYREVAQNGRLWTCRDEGGFPQPKTSFGGRGAAVLVLFVESPAHNKECSGLQHFRPL